MRFLILCIICLSGQAMAQQQFTLSEAQNYAISNNPRAKLAQLEVDQALLKVREFQAIGLPQVNAEGSFQNFIDLPTNLVPAEFFGGTPGEFLGVQFGTDYNVTGSIGATQLLFDGSFLTGLKASKLYPVISEQQQQQVKQDILASVEQAYYMVAIAEKNSTFLTTMNGANDQLKAYLLILQEKGMMDSAAIDQVDLSLKKIAAQQKKANLDKKLALTSLKLSMGMNMSDAIGISDDLETIIKRIKISTTIEPYNVETDLNIQLLNTSMELEMLNLDVKKAAYLPSLAAFINHQQQAQRNKLDLFADQPWYPTTVWGLQLNIPIYSGGKRNAQVKQQEIEIKKVEANMDIVKRNLQMQYDAALTEFKGAQEIYEAENEAFAIAEKIKRRTTTLYNKQVATMVEVAQADLQLEQSHSNLIQAMYAYVNAKVKLDKITNNQ